MASELKGLSCQDWQIGEYINHGKSAIVCESSKDGKSAALKIFDPEIVERYGCEIQQERIERECKLIGITHPNLVEILDGGEWKEKGIYYIVMELLPWKNLAEVLADIPQENEQKLLIQLVDAAEFLESQQLCHRDIKPENIAVCNQFEHLKLLDFGVVRPVGSVSITDGTNSTNFVGTLRYSPPEFLLRQEKDTIEGWRAVTFYQIGGVLHDLIVREPLFKKFESPPAVLVNAVQYEIPEFRGAKASYLLIDIAKACLVKKTRIATFTSQVGKFQKN